MSDAEELRGERDKLNSEVRRLISESRKLSSEITSLHARARNSERERDRAIAMARELNKHLKALRTKKKEKAGRMAGLEKTIAEKAAGRDKIGRLKSRIRKLDWLVQTEVLDSRTEDKLAGKVIVLEQELRESRRAGRLKKELHKTLVQLSDMDYEAELVEDLAADQARLGAAAHKRTLELYKKARKLKKGLKKTSAELDAAKEASNRAHRAYLKALKSASRKKATKPAKPPARRQGRRLEDAAEKLIEALKKGKKLTNEELKMIQRGSKGKR